MTESRVYLVSCVSQKAPHRARARDLYRSPWFRKARAYVERTGSPWFILSAKHGLLHPDDEVGPYEVSLNQMRARERLCWAEDVLEQLLPRLSRGSRVIFFAGGRYRQYLAAELDARGFGVDVPMAGLPIGKQLQWLGARERDIEQHEAERIPAIERLYSILDDLRSRLGCLTLADCHGRMDWPKRGLYLFFEKREERSTSGTGLRVTRVGTHAVSRGSKTALWRRLAQHRGTKATGGGNHRGSIFRLLVGQALIEQGGIECPTWGDGSSAGASIRKAEHDLECLVSDRIRSMPFLFIAADDEPGPASMRAFIERNLIALLSNRSACGNTIDPPSRLWLGNWSPVDAVRESGLWNSKHVSETPDHSVLELLARMVRETK